MTKRNVRWRLTLHFTYQLLLLIILIMLGLIAVFFIAFQAIINEDIKRRFPIGALDTIMIQSYIDENNVKFSNGWVKHLTEQQYWIQVINKEGRVLESVNAPNDLPSIYQAGDLYKIQQTKRYGAYEVWISLSEASPTTNSLLYMMGYMNEGATDLQHLYDKYAKDGLIREDAAAQLDKELISTNRTLQVMNVEGHVQQSIGLTMERSVYEPLELLIMEEMRGDYPTNISVYTDPQWDTYWILHDSKKEEYVQLTPFKGLIIILVSLCGAILLTTLIFSIYHGYRYGRPLLLFIDWFERLGKGQYDVQLPPKEWKRLYRKNGKLRYKYGLYKEVIDGFSKMTARLNALEQDRLLLEKTREEWMTGISHDLRTPLSSIQGYGHLLGSGQYSFTDEELQEMGGTIRDKSDYMLDLIQDFSLAFQLKNKQIPFQVKPIKLRELVRRIVLNYVNDITKEGTTFQYETSEDDTHSIQVLVNEKWFTRMLDNIIINAIKHNPNGTTIKISVWQSNESAVLSVTDDGSGMDKETLNNLFERYYRGTNTEETFGAGLGMSIAKSIVLAHSGTIQAESQVGMGTTVTVILPLWMETQRS